MTRWQAAFALATAGAALAGCNNQPGELNAAAEKVLKPHVQSVRRAAASGSYSRLRSEVHTLETLVDREVELGNVSSSRANAIKDAADALLVDAAPTPRPTPTQTTPTPTQSSASPKPTASSSPPSTSPTTSSTDSSSAQPSSTVSVP